MAVKVTVKKDSIKKEEPKVETKKTTTTCSEKCVNKNADVPVYTSIDGNIHVNKEYAKEFPEIILELVKSECRKSERRNDCYANKWEGFRGYCEPCKCNECDDEEDEDDEDIYDEEYGPEEETYTKEVLVPKLIKYLERLGFKVEEISKF